MIENGIEGFIEVTLPCSRFGGTRPAVCCVHFDRYRNCRRNCSELKKLLIQRPDFAKLVEDYFAERSKKPVSEGGLFECKSSQSGKNLPDPLLGCKYCNFIAKSPRGLKIHMRRTHKKIQG